MDAIPKVARYARYAFDNKISVGLLDGDTVRELRGDLFDRPELTGTSRRLGDVKLLPPVQPSKVVAIGLNYKSHVGERKHPEYPGVFLKAPSCIIATGEDVVYPADASNLHFEGEMVLVIGKKSRNVSPETAHEAVFGITIGNDISERNWQKGDLQWFRAKGSDTFGPLGPVVACGLNYGDLLLETRVNGQTKQSQRTSDLIFDVPTIVSYVTRYVTLFPGDVIFTGTPGTTSAMQPGDSVEVEIEGVGVLKNRIVAAS